MWPSLDWVSFMMLRCVTNANHCTSYYPPRFVLSSLRVSPVINRPAEFQIPPQLSRYASFLFSFLGRGLCEFSLGVVLSHANDAQSTSFAAPSSLLTTPWTKFSELPLASSVSPMQLSSSFPRSSPHKTWERPMADGVQNKSKPHHKFVQDRKDDLPFSVGTSLSPSSPWQTLYSSTRYLFII